jgi:hypothetical protein
MEIIREFNDDVVDALMNERGYGLVSVNMNGEVVSKRNYAKSTNLGVVIHAIVDMKSRSIDLSMVELKYCVQLQTSRFDFFHPQFERYEKIIYIYSHACLSAGNVFEKADALPSISNELFKIAIPPLPTNPPPAEKPTKKTIEERKRDFWMEVAPIAKQKGLTKEFTMEFYSYWTEHGPNDKTFRKEREKPFDISKRLATFVRNEKKWNKDKIVEKAEKQDKALTERKQNAKHKDLF